MGYSKDDYRYWLKKDCNAERNMNGKEITQKIHEVATLKNAIEWEADPEKWMFITYLLDMDTMYSEAILENAVIRLENRLAKLLKKERAQS